MLPQNGSEFAFPSTHHQMFEINFPILFTFNWISLQLNQQQNHSKGAANQDYSFLKEASPIYVTSLTGNHVSGTTTVTGTVSNLPGSNCISTPSSAATATSLLHNNNLQYTATTATPPINVVSTHQVHVHQPPSASLATISAANKLTTNIQVNPTPLAGGWLIGESAQGTLITTNNQQIFQNLNSINNNNSNSSTALANTINNGNSNNNQSGSAINNNNSNINNTNRGSSVKTNSASVAIVAGAPAAVAAAAPSSTTTDGNNLTKYYGNTSSSTTSTSGAESLANGHGPRREVSLCLHLIYLFHRLHWLRNRSEEFKNLPNSLSRLSIFVDKPTADPSQLEDINKFDFEYLFRCRCFFRTADISMRLNRLTWCSSYQHLRKVIQRHRKIRQQRTNKIAYHQREIHHYHRLAEPKYY